VAGGVYSGEEGEELEPRGQEEELGSDRTSGAIQQSISMRPIIYIK